jgi:hypothetical protein
MLPSTQSYCFNCNESSPRYKCPTCYIPYCSVSCCKIHKSLGCNKTISPEKDDIDIPEIFKENESTIGFRILSNEEKVKINHSAYIQRMILSKRLRKHLEEIDKSENRLESLRKMRSRNPEFEEFITKALEEIK